MIRSVLFDARLVLGHPTGIGRYIVSLLPAMARAAPGCTLHVLRRPDPWPGYGFAEWTAPNVVHHVSPMRHMSAAQYVALPRLSRRLGVDLLHHPHFDAPVLIRTVPVIATIHDAKYLTHRNLFARHDASKRWLLARAFALTMARADGIIADSAATADDLRRLFWRKGPVHIVPLAADPSFAPAPEAAVEAFRARHGVRRRYVLCVGEFRPHKNHALLIRAFAASSAARTHELVLIGQRHDLSEPPEQVAAAAGVGDRVRVLTDVRSDGLVAAYTGADAFVLASLHEGFGLPILEAMACGCPVVASGTTASGEVAGDAAVRVNPERVDEVTAAIDRVLGDPREAARLRAAGLARARTYTWDATARGTLAAYEAVLGMRP